MTVPTPDWLRKHDGELHLGKAEHSASVYFAGQLQYFLLPTPTQGRFSCRVTQTINGKRLENLTTYASADEALLGGLEDLRKSLGW
jgi:hypothetical protein